MMRGFTPLLPACWLLSAGCHPDPLGAEYAGTSASLALSNGASAVAVLGQVTMDCGEPARTDEGGFSNVAGVAAAPLSTRLWVADRGNNRIVGFANTDAMTGGTALPDMVLNQPHSDFYTTDFSGIPVAQRVEPAGVAVDREQRVYVISASSPARVLVYEDPFAHDALFDYELLGLPHAVRGVRTLSNNRLAVIGHGSGGGGSVVFYERGNPAPLVEATLVSPCGDEIYDVTEHGGFTFVACNQSVLCSSGFAECGGVYAYAQTATTGLPQVPHTPVLVYSDLVGATSLGIDSGYLLVADMPGNRILRYMNPASLAQSIISGDIASPLYPSDAISIYGQPDATSVVTNYYSATLSRVSSRGLHAPSHISLDPDDHRMWVVDSGNSRVLAFTSVIVNPASEDAQVVLGQPNSDYGHNNNLEPNAFSDITGVALGDDDGGTLRAAVVDRGAHRVLLYDHVEAYATGGDPQLVLGQATTKDYLPPPTPSERVLHSPSHVTIGPDGTIWVTDSGHKRVLGFPASGDQAATRVFGAQAGTAAGVYNSLGAVAVSDTHLFVAAGNRIFMYAVAEPSTKPKRVFGQLQPPVGDPTDDDIDNLENAGASVPGPGSLRNVTGLALDSEGRLWVADAGNNRVLWFDAPSGADLNSAVLADGVVGQPDMASRSAHMGGARSRFGFAGLSGLGIAADGTLWVSDAADSRVLAFATPMAADPTAGVPVASVVLGQASFTAAGANNQPGGVGAHTMSTPFAVAVSPDSRTVLVSDAGNNRGLLFTTNRPPIITGGGTFDVVVGEPASIELNVVDPDGDPWQMRLLEPVPENAILLDSSISYVAPEGTLPGTVVRVTLVVEEQGPHPHVVSASFLFRVIARHPDATPGTPPAPRPMPEPQSCAAMPAGITFMSLALGAALLRRRRRL